MFLEHEFRNKSIEGFYFDSKLLFRVLQKLQLLH